MLQQQKLKSCHRRDLNFAPRKWKAHPASCSLLSPIQLCNSEIHWTRDKKCWTLSWNWQGNASPIFLCTSAPKVHQISNRAVKERGFGGTLLQLYTIGDLKFGVLKGQPISSSNNFPTKLLPRIKWPWYCNPYINFKFNRVRQIWKQVLWGSGAPIWSAPLGGVQ